MQDSKTNLIKLQKRLNELETENLILKQILDRNGISYWSELKLNDSEEFSEDQGGRIVHPVMITETMANIFFSHFWGRQDVYAKRSENKDTKKVGYYVQCDNFWKDFCPMRVGPKKSCSKCKYRVHKRLTKYAVLAHLQGNSISCNDVIGVYPLLPGNVCRFLVFDFDNHEAGAEQKDFANVNDNWIEEVDAMRKICDLNGIPTLVERSRSGRGAHVWIFFREAISASVARKFGFALLDKGAEQVNLRSFRFYDRMLPAQDELKNKMLGNLIALPLQGQALKKGNSAFVDQNWNAYPDQWKILYQVPKLSLEFVEERIKEWSVVVSNYQISDDLLNPSDVSGNLFIQLSDGISICSVNVSPSLMNKIRRMAAFQNPVYFKNRAIGFNNFSIARWIYLGEEEENDFLKIPRGLFSEFIEKLNQSEIGYEILDNRQRGRCIEVSFQGQLRDEQAKALNEMLKFDNGILHAATAFGKTVVCAALIAQRKVNTLILIESSALLDQWKQSLEDFLIIEEELPEYTTKSGQIRRRKSLIGRLQGSSDSMTGIVDVAMVGSLKKKGEFHPLLDEYGMVIVDECHHAASETISEILKYVKCKYVYGVTATPKRSDGLEKINYMLLGPIRHVYSAKDKAASQNTEHVVIPRFTRTVLPSYMQEIKSPNEAYELIRNNEARDCMIVSDVERCILEGRTPVVLSRYKDHSIRLYELLKEKADYVFLMTGNNSRRVHRKILEQLHTVSKKSSLILVATGSLIGEGFDFPRLDTLIMATPVSFQSVVEQYAGRLNRDYEGKKSVMIYDYVDSHISMFDKMYIKRMAAYKKIGFHICGNDWIEKMDANSLFDSTNYERVYKADLVSAHNSIVISSPVICTNKVNELILLLKDCQVYGVKVTIVTLDADCYSFGETSFWMMLHEKMRRAGFYVQLVNDICKHFAIVDEEWVWYGNMNLLGKDSIEDNMMRIKDKNIAAELMESLIVS